MEPCPTSVPEIEIQETEQGSVQPQICLAFQPAIVRYFELFSNEKKLENTKKDTVVCIVLLGKSSRKNTIACIV
jgi:hypothetical protein